MRGMREAHEDWLALRRDLIARGLGRRCYTAAARCLADGLDALAVAAGDPLREPAR
jgi:sulfur transfer complex TusBCD TusB component (DsrH family)